MVAISAGLDHCLALKSDGTVVGGGAIQFYQGEIPADLTNIVAISAGYSHDLALRADGTVIAWGRNDYGQCDVPAQLSNVVAISAGWVFSLALLSDGTVVVWGTDECERAGGASRLRNVTAISAGSMWSMAIVGDGRPTITVQPWSLMEAPGDTATFRVLASGTPPLSYQWQRNGVAMSGATNATLLLSNVQTNQSGHRYSVVVANALGSVTSDEAVLTVAPCELGGEYTPDDFTWALYHFNGDFQDSSGHGRHLTVENPHGYIGFADGRAGGDMGQAAAIAQYTVDWDNHTRIYSPDLRYPGEGSWTVEALVWVPEGSSPVAFVWHYSEHWAGHEPVRLGPDTRQPFLVRHPAGL